MNTSLRHVAENLRPCDAAMARLNSTRFDPIMFCRWERVMFINLEVDRATLQRATPFTLDLFDGRAIVTLVAFNVAGLRPRIGGKLGAWLFKPLQIGGLFNVRTYVRCQGEPAIYFLAEWLNSKINLSLGPITYGLPYRAGRLSYHHSHELGAAEGEVYDPATGTHARYRAQVRGPYHPAAAGSLDEFVLERYTCFTWFRGPRRRFRIWHEPWPQARAEMLHVELPMLTAHWPWMRDARILSVNFSPGLDDVWLGRPHVLEARLRSAALKLP